MALREPLMIKVQEGNTDLSLSAQAGQSLLVHGISVVNPTAAHVTLICDRTTVGFFRSSGEQGNHLFFPADGDVVPNMLGFLIAMGLMKGYPVPEGMTFSLSGAKAATAIQMIAYSIWDAGDQRAADPNGPDSAAFCFLGYGGYSTTVADGVVELVTSNCPVEFPAFPFGVASPAGRRVRIHGIAFSDITEDSATGTNVQRTEYLKLVRERVTLFDEDRVGLLYYGGTAVNDSHVVAAGQSVGGGLSDVDSRPPLMFPEPLVFEGNEELNVYLQTEVTAGVANLAAADCEVGFIMTVE